MRLPFDFDVVETDAIADLSIDFTKDVPVGQTMVSAVWALSLELSLDGAAPDPTPDQRRVGSAVLVGAVTTQRVAGLFPGNTYLVTATGTMSDGEVVVLWTLLPCLNPGQIV